MDNTDHFKTANALLELIARGKRMYAPSLANLNKKELLALALKALLEHQKATLELVQGVNALAKATVEEGKAALQPEPIPAPKKYEPPRVNLSDTEIRCNTDSELVLWYLRGEHNVSGRIDIYYPTKMAAEIAARVLYPDESEDRRYSRVFYHVFSRPN